MTSVKCEIIFSIFIHLLLGVGGGSQENFVDSCKYNRRPPQTRCGDQCMADNVNCICGKARLIPYYGPQYCCVDPSPDNITQCFVNEYGQGICPQGRVLDKTEPCNGLCYNDYHASEQIGYDSQFHCEDKCVPQCGKCAEATLDV